MENKEIVVGNCNDCPLKNEDDYGTRCLITKSNCYFNDDGELLNIECPLE
jgi:hypothetical protein